MSRSNNPYAYTYTKPILDEAVSRGRVTYSLQTVKEAHKWRFHANSFRKAMSLSGPTAYDGLELILSGTDVIIQQKMVPGILKAEDGSQIDFEREVPEPATDELMAFAKKFVRDLPEITDD